MIEAPANAVQTLAIAVLIGGFSVAELKAQGAPDKAFGAFLSSQCVTCHMISGKTVGSIPAIIGWPEAQFLTVMASYKKKERTNTLMQVIAGRLSDEDTAALAAYFGALKPDK
jgi:cytochrome c553